MDTITIIKLVLIGIGLLTAGGLYLRLKKGNKAIKEKKALKEVNETTVATEKRKNDVREIYNEKADSVINNPNGPNVVLPVVSTEHNHSFRSPCTPDCPAYSGE